jgi:nucleoside-diphosphate-sugar epimerase
MTHSSNHIEIDKRRILIAGITGFLGSRLALELTARRDVSVAGLYRDCSRLDRLRGIQSKLDLHNIDRQDLSAILQKGRFDIVVNCLADYRPSQNDIKSDIANYQLPVRLFELAKGHGVQVFLNAGTSLPRELNTYSRAKHEFSLRMQEHQKEIAAVDAKLEHFYGAGESESRFISFLISQFLMPAHTLNLTHGEQRRDFLHVDDAVKALLTLIDHGMTCDPGYYSVPMGSGEAYLLKDVVELVRNLTNNWVTRIVFGAVPYREHEVMLSRADVSLLKKLGWRANLTLTQGLAQMIGDYRQLHQLRAAS